MASTICQCPGAESLETVPINKCIQRLDQIARFMIQRTFNDDGELNYFDVPGQTAGGTVTQVGDYKVGKAYTDNQTGIAYDDLGQAAAPKVNQTIVDSANKKYTIVKVDDTARTFDVGVGAAAPVNTGKDLSLRATIDAAFKATDSSKLIISPISGVGTPVVTPGAARTYGSEGDNSTSGGVQINLGRNNATFTCNILQSAQNTISALKKLQCESDLSIYFINVNGQIICSSDDSENPTKYFGFRLAPGSFYVSDLQWGALDQVETNSVQASLLANYSDELVVFKPEYDALTVRPL